MGLIVRVFTLLLVWLVHAQTDVSRYRECFDSGTNPETIVRVTPMKIWYSLAGITTAYRGFPELHDKFFLKKAQRVKIEYKINIWFLKTGLFWTRLKINNKVQEPSYFVTTITHERTHFYSDLVWL